MHGKSTATGSRIYKGDTNPHFIAVSHYKNTENQLNSSSSNNSQFTVQTHLTQDPKDSKDPGSAKPHVSLRAAKLSL